MNPSNFMIGMASAIATDIELQAWCQEILGKELTVQVGVDLDNPPEVETYPICALLDVVEKRGESQRNLVYELDLSVALYDKEVKVDGNLRIYSGLPKVAELKSRVDGALLRSGLAQSIDFVADDAPLSLFPLFVGYSTAECQLIKSSRAALRR